MRSHRPSQPAISTRRNADHGTVAAPHEASVQAGLTILEAGGNAIDAAVAAALVAGVIEPTETTLAGSGFFLAHTSAGETWSVDFGPKAPFAATNNMFDIEPNASSSSVLGLAPVVDNANVDGALASGVPRTLLGLLTAQERFGKLDRADVLQPAITAAYEGFPSDTWFLTSALSDLARLRKYEGTRTTFLDENDLPIGHTSMANYGPTFAGHTFVRQPRLGATLEEVADQGPESLTSGVIAERLVKTSTDLGGILSMSDLRNAAPAIRPALKLQYRDCEIAVPAAPGGGITELEILNIWQQLNPSPSTSHESPKKTRELALAMRHAFADRYHWLGDPAVAPIPTQELLAPEYARDIAEQVATGRDVPRWSEGAPWSTFASFGVHDPWLHSENRGHRPDWNPTTANTPTSGTTHISVADTAGNTVSITHTAANHFGNGIMCPRTGLMLDSAMAWFNAMPGAANSITPGGRALANMGPALITRNGASVAALGASGGRRIISAVAQLVINLVDGHNSFDEALALPRIDASGQHVLVHEGRAQDYESLSDLGATLVPSSNEPFTMDFARPNIAGYDTSGTPCSAISMLHYTD